MIDIRSEITEAKRQGNTEGVKALQLRQIEIDKIPKKNKKPKVITP